MIVTKVTKLGKDRFLIKLDTGISFPLYKTEMNRFDTKEGSDLSDGELDEIMTRILPSRCIKRAMNLLQKKSYAQAELAGKLEDGGYPEEIVSKAMEYVMSFGYIDDVRYAADYIRYHSSQGRGRNRIRLELRGKGISDEAFDKAWDQMEEVGLVADSNAQIEKLLEKKHFSPDMDRSDKEKIAAFILRRGFSSEDIFRCMRSYSGRSVV
ncbi:MAG: regulatory protein RecX [Lachnospiraceae bacterium]|nr:regulatory protein RecX [Lachnospiraceae bacterium]